MKPIIGLSSSYNEGEYRLMRTYTDAIVRAGGIPVMLPYFASGDGEAVLSRVDALLLTGGMDVEPQRYGREAHPLTQATTLDRDAQELELLSAAFSLRMPVMGICRGIQMLNVFLGGTLVQDIPDSFSVNHNKVTHPVVVKRDSFLWDIVGEEYVANSTHHQAVGITGDGLRPIAWSVEGIVEAAEHLERKNIFAVQWHPERIGDEASGKLFQRLVDFAKGYRMEG